MSFREPDGSGILLPHALRHRQTLVEKILQVFGSRGYQTISTPLIEPFETFERGLGPQELEMCVRFVDDRTGAPVAVRPDVTPQIARLVSQQPAYELDVQLCYAADIVRRGADDVSRIEQHQVGVEWIGKGDLESDVQVVETCYEVLSVLGLSSCIELSHVGVLGSFVPTEVLQDEELLRRFAVRDGSGVVKELRRRGTPVVLIDQIVEILEYNGDPLALDALCFFPNNPGLSHLNAMIKTLVTRGVRREHLAIDLADVRGFGYYTGFRMQVWAHGFSQALGRGGRYDALCRRYGADRPAVGFALDVDHLSAWGNSPHANTGAKTLDERQL